MTTPEPQSPAPRPQGPAYQDQVHRSSAAIAGGVLLLAIVLWLGLDAIMNGGGRVPWLALAVMILVVPLVVAFTLRPAVYANEDRLRIRNPFRVIVLPWGQVAGLRSGYSNEALTKSGAKYQMWALPVSLRGRKKAARNEARAAAAERDPGRGAVPGRLGGGPAGQSGPHRAANDKIMDDLRELAEARESAESAQGEVTVRWAYEILGPALAGAVVLAILLAVG
ncbi:PH domain-containing protein [Streptomyces sp. NPDC046831]|uniref:PH domain-containing protein n=1 Tax=Streptomyces sp. NPDC046831 TaxID=3154805 RepID=UPI0033C361EE